MDRLNAWGPAVLISVILALGIGVITEQEKVALNIHCTNLRLLILQGQKVDPNDYQTAKANCRKQNHLSSFRDLSGAFPANLGRSQSAYVGKGKAP